MPVDENALILLAEVVGVHGIRGQVKLKCFSHDPAGLPSYRPLYTADGQPAGTVTAIQAHGPTWIATIENVADRNTAEKLRGKKFYVRRAQLPALDDDAFYHTDLIGMTALWPDGTVMGKVIGIDNFGAGDLIDIQPAKGQSFYVPFNDDCVPEINLGARNMTVNPPAGLLDDTDDAKDTTA